MSVPRQSVAAHHLSDPPQPSRLPPNPFGGTAVVPAITRSFVRDSLVPGSSEDRRQASIRRMRSSLMDPHGLPDTKTSKKAKSVKQEKGKGRARRSESPPKTPRLRILFLPVHVSILFI
jgi:hypothetical protein